MAIIYGSWGAPFKRNIILERDTWYSFDRIREYGWEGMNAIHRYAREQLFCHTMVLLRWRMPKLLFLHHPPVPLCGVLHGWGRSKLNRCFTGWLYGVAMDRHMTATACHGESYKPLCRSGSTGLGQSKIGCLVRRRVANHRHHGSVNSSTTNALIKNQTKIYHLRTGLENQNYKPLIAWCGLRFWFLVFGFRF